LVKAANLPIELLDIGLKLTSKIRNLIPQRAVSRKLRSPVETKSVAAWDQFVARHIELLQESEAARRPIQEQIEAALERLEDSSYGICVACGSKIPKARLNAIPYTPNCVRCASELEG